MAQVVETSWRRSARCCGRDLAAEKREQADKSSDERPADGDRPEDEGERGELRAVIAGEAEEGEDGDQRRFAHAVSADADRQRSGGICGGGGARDGDEAEGKSHGAGEQPEGGEVEQPDGDADADGKKERGEWKLEGLRDAAQRGGAIGAEKTMGDFFPAMTARGAPPNDQHGYEGADGAEPKGAKRRTSVVGEEMEAESERSECEQSREAEQAIDDEAGGVAGLAVGCDAPEPGEANGVTGDAAR